MRRLALICGLLWAGFAAAQPVVSRFDLDGKEVHRFNAADCSGTDMAFFLELNVPSSTPYQLRFVEYPRSGPLGACPTERAETLATDILPEETQTPAGNVILVQRELARADLMGAESCAGDARRDEVYFCLQIFALPGDLLALGTAAMTFDIDTTLPPSATVTDVRGGDGVVFVDVDAIISDEGDSVGFRVEHRLCPLPADVVEDVDPDSTCGAATAFESTTGAAPTIEIAVENGRTAEFRVVAIDDFDNESDPTLWQQGTPEADVSALALYDGETNDLSCDLSGCTDADAALPLGAALLWWRRRRPSSSKRRLPPALLTLALLLGATSADAQSRPDDPESKRFWNGLGRTTVSMSLNTYKPNLDSGSTFPVYECFFDDATLPQISGNGDLHLWDGFGTLQMSLGFDITQANGFAQPLDAVTSKTCQRPTTTTVQTTFVSVRPGLTYRFDPFLDWFGIPLVPYGRVGLVGIGYLFSKGGEVAGTEQHNPIGARLGAEAALGLMLALDFLDGVDPFTPDSTRRARANGIFDHTFIFVEGAAMDVTTFGQPGFDLSPRDDFLSSGLPASFKVGLAVELL